MDDVGAPAFAAHTATAFSIFHVMSPIDGVNAPYECLLEDWGAVRNNCTYKVYVTFALPIDRVDATHTVKVQNYVKGTGTIGATCWIYSYDGDGNGHSGTSATFNPNGVQTLTFTSVAFGNSMSLICELPVGEGIAAINWVP